MCFANFIRGYQTDPLPESFKAAELCSADSRRQLSPHLLLPSDTIMFGLTLGTIDSAGI
jgi:hypothetical protein